MVDYRSSNPYVTQDGNGSADDAFTIVPSDSVNFTTPARAIYSGAGGDITLVTPGGTTILFSAVPAGMILPVKATRVNATGTIATNLVGIV